jgi:ribonucleoside-diphosphate reductase alpha chain
MRAMSHMYRRAWRAGLKTTYYLRTLGASGIDKATVGAADLTRRAPVDDAVPQGPSCAIDAGPDCEACQ